ncbi:MAG: dTMP kinase [Candidatus Pacebacteria bacterium]|nr:dTMP kinase [Candidatus Paceibacterota bacterium]MDD5012972.1 dTMP kinase [Candidatus Paceibacterota bacterium]MDD5753080.1 dTMP kinase [Candidatus Paceibacterota bacterium]
MQKGKFIIIEGIDGCGGETQTRLLSDFLLKQGKEIKELTYPQYDKPIGQLIHNFLYEKYDLSPEVQALIYFSEFVKDKEEIKKDIDEGKILISDRYFTSTLVYQGLRGVELEKLISLSNLFDIVRPDMCIYLKISPETSRKRKSKEKQGDLDRNERDLELLKNLVNVYDKVAKNNLFCKWEIINGEQSIEEVHNQIIKLI